MAQLAGHRMRADQAGPVITVRCECGWTAENADLNLVMDQAMEHIKAMRRQGAEVIE